LEILYIDEIDSTQEYLKDKLKSGELNIPIAVCTNRQTSGQGSRGNKWESGDGNLYFSFALTLSELPDDLRVESASIYFAIIMKSTLSYYGSNLHIKWPNDFYIDDKKIGGIITSKIGESLVCGIGINTKKAPSEYGVLDTVIDNEYILRDFFKLLDKKISWEHCFETIYKDEFEHSKNLTTHIDDEVVSLSDAELNSDGSIEINGKRVYSLR
jgi:BirA family biotin operon repressor/biotin-[acetyl-CoA-carboxylase] ligase